jgi:hypothetical protein
MTLWRRFLHCFFYRIDPSNRERCADCGARIFYSFFGVFHDE